MAMGPADRGATPFCSAGAVTLAFTRAHQALFRRHTFIGPMIHPLEQTIQEQASTCSFPVLLLTPGSATDPLGPRSAPDAHHWQKGILRRRLIEPVTLCLFSQRAADRPRQLGIGCAPPN